MTYVFLLLVPVFSLVQEDTESEYTIANRMKLVLSWALQGHDNTKELGASREQIIKLFPLTRKSVADLKPFKNVLSPKQLNRWIQVGHQLKFWKEVPDEGLMSDGLLKKFKLEDKEDAVKKIDAEIKRQLFDLEKKHRQEINELLSMRDGRIKKIIGPDKSKKYDSHFGKPTWFYLQPTLDELLREWPKD